MSPEQPALYAENFTVRREGRTLVAVPCLRVGPGEVFILTGESGAGKSSLLLALALLIPAEGNLRIGELRAAGEPPHRWRARVHYVPATPQLLGETIGADLRFPFTLAAHRHRPSPDDATLRTQLHRLGLPYPLARDPRELSQGERARLALARSLLVAPEVLLLDEPTANLDAATTHRVRAAIADYATTGGRVIIAAHDDRMADMGRGLLLRDARLEAME